MIVTVDYEYAERRRASFEVPDDISRSDVTDAAEEFARSQIEASAGEHTGPPVLMTVNWKAGSKFGGRMVA